MAIACPSCRHPLDSSITNDGRHPCPGCGVELRTRQGVVDFIPWDDFYWGEIDDRKMRKLNDEADQGQDWYRSLKDNLADHPSLIRYATDPARSGWLFHCYDPGQNQACLDIGSGLGLLSFCLSRYYQAVYSLDGVFERLRFQAIRAKIDGVRNIAFLRSSLLKLPLEDRSMDLVVLNGVFEWVGLSNPHEKPGDLQRCLFSEIKRVLKPGGRIYLGIENRLSLLYFLGGRDHSGLRYTSLVPRAIASRMVRKAHRKKVSQGSQRHVFCGAESEYRTYTYSLGGYRRLLQQAGFSNIHLYWAWQSYSYPRMSGPFDGKSIRYTGLSLLNLTDNKWRRLLLRAGLLLPDRLIALLTRVFWPHFLIIAGQNNSPETNLQKRITDENTKTRSFVRLALGANGEVKSTFLLLSDRGKVLTSIRVSEEARDSSPAYALTCRAEQGVEGRSIRPYNKKDIQKAARWLAAYQMSAGDRYWPEQDLIDEIRRLVQMALSMPGYDHDRALLKGFEDIYIRLIKKHTYRVVGEHGDFTPPNLLVTPEKELVVLDWEFKKTNGNPLMDVGGFYLSLLRRAGADDKCINQSKTDGPIAWFTGGLSPCMNIPFTLSPSYYLLRVMERFLGQKNAACRLATFELEWGPLMCPTLEYSLGAGDPTA